MKIAPLSPASRPRSSQPVQERPQPHSQAVQALDAIEDIDPDRRRSLQEEISLVEPNVLGPFHGEAKVLEAAREVASELLSHATHSTDLIKPAFRFDLNDHIDDKA